MSVCLCNVLELYLLPSRGYIGTNWQIQTLVNVNVLDYNLWPVVCKNFAGKHLIFHKFSNQFCRISITTNFLNCFYYYFYHPITAVLDSVSQSCCVPYVLFWKIHLPPLCSTNNLVTQLYVTTIYHNTMKPNIPVVDWMFSSSSSFVHLQNKQKQTFASDNYHVATAAYNQVSLSK